MHKMFFEMWFFLDNYSFSKNIFEWYLEIHSILQSLQLFGIFIFLKASLSCSGHTVIWSTLFCLYAEREKQWILWTKYTL